MDVEGGLPRVAHAGQAVTKESDRALRRSGAAAVPGPSNKSGRGTGAMVGRRSKRKRGQQPQASCTTAGKSSVANPPRVDACSSHRREYRPGARIGRWLGTALSMYAICRVAVAVCNMAPTPSEDRARRTHLKGPHVGAGLASPAAHAI